MSNNIMYKLNESIALRVTSIENSKAVKYTFSIKH